MNKRLTTLLIGICLTSNSYSCDEKIHNSETKRDYSTLAREIVGIEDRIITPHELEGTFYECENKYDDAIIRVYQTGEVIIDPKNKRKYISKQFEVYSQEENPNDYVIPKVKIRDRNKDGIEDIEVDIAPKNLKYIDEINRETLTRVFLAVGNGEFKREDLN